MKTIRTSRRPSPLSAMLAGFAALAFCLVGLPASAQFRDQSISITNTVPAASTNSSPGSAVIDVTRVSEFALQISFKLGGAGTSAVAWDIQKSVDGVNYVSAFTLPITANGTTTVSAVTNVTAGAVPYWKISSIGNPNASATTNHVVTLGLKRQVD